MAPKLSDQLQKCKSIDDVIDAFVNAGFKLAHEIDPRRKALSITPSGGDFLNIVVVDKMPSGLQPPEKRARVHAALYISKNFELFKFYHSKLISGKEPSYSFTTAVLKSPTQFGNLARVKINGLRFSDLNTIYRVVEPSSEQAIRGFEENLSVIIDLLRDEIVTKISKDPALDKIMKDTVTTFSSFIGPEFSYNALIELLIQHLLTKDIFSEAYGNTFREGNVVANSLENLAYRFADIPTLVNDGHELRERRDSIIQVIQLNPIEKRLEIIKQVYEAFYSVYNPRDADRLGIVYTPKVAVDFIIRATDKLMSKYLHASVSDKNIHIIDPCIGTGTFMISLLNHMNQKGGVSKQALITKYTKELHANEVSILAYYIAAMNVERAFESITGRSEPFQGIVWRDTLLTVNLDDFPVQGNDNVARMKSQRNRKITVILGNPPYNVGQKNFGDGNSNPTYFSTYGGVDDRITQTYHKKSQFRKQTRDMYKRFVRWASDLIGERGIIGFISNSSFVHANNYDGMRACLEEEFDFVYVCDLRGNANTRGKKRKQEGGGFFGEKSKVGIAIYFLIKTGQHTKKHAEIYYSDVGNYKTQKQKFEWVENKLIDTITFKRIKPSVDYNWGDEKPDPNYRKFTPLVSFETKRGKSDNAIFQLFTNGIQTGADDWQTDFDPQNLRKKIVPYLKEYNRVRFIHTKNSGEIIDYIEKSSIPWYSGLDRKAARNEIMKFRPSSVFSMIYRPFVTKYFHYDDVAVQTISKWSDIIQDSPDIPVMCVRARSAHRFECIAARGFVDRAAILHSQNIPLYRLDANGEKISNLTNFGRIRFHSHYQNSNISDEDIFYYCYAVLNDPIYVEKYGHGVRTLHPHIPLHPKFYEWSGAGKALFKLHADFKTQPKYQLCQVDEGGDASKFILNLAPSGPKTWKARIDESLSIDGLPPEAADPKSGGYAVGARTPIGWVLEYYQKACKQSARSKVPEKFALLDFSAHRDEIVDLVYRLCTVSIKTVQTRTKISKLPHSWIPCKKSCCKKGLTKTSSASRKNVSKKHTKQIAGQKEL